jgi:hypothetical protein
MANSRDQTEQTPGHDVAELSTATGEDVHYESRTDEDAAREFAQEQGLQ